MNKSLLYFTDNRLDQQIFKMVQDQLKTFDLPIISVSLQPILDFGTNIHLPLERGRLTMFKQILAGLEASVADIIFMTEHDCLYHKSNFDFIPPDPNTFYYNHNWWKVHNDGVALHWDADQVSGLCAYRDPLIAYYRKRVGSFEEQTFDRKYEPEGEKGSESWKSEFPMIDIRHNKNLTYNKRSLKDFRNKATAKNFEESTIDKIPGWSLTTEIIYGNR